MLPSFYLYFEKYIYDFEKSKCLKIFHSVFYVCLHVTDHILSCCKKTKALFKKISLYMVFF